MSLHDFFLWPAALPLLLLAPLVWFFLRWQEKRKARALANVIGPRAEFLASERSRSQRRLRILLLCSGLFLALLALLQPIWGEELRKVEQRGVDIIVCLDVSQSMLARDLLPNRLARAQREIRALAEKVRGDRMGLVVFAGEARLTVPLTQDMDSFAQLVELAEPGNIKKGGTDLGIALETALKALEGQSGDHEVVLLLTDGEDLEQRGLKVAETFAQKKIVLHCVGFGSRQGSKIAVEGKGGETFLRDASGNEVVSAMDSTGLRKIAEATGGEFVDAAAMALPLIELYEKRVIPMVQKSFESEERLERKNRFQWPLLAAFALWMIELCFTDRRRK